jgi:hydrogenase maturation protein HypF
MGGELKATFCLLKDSEAILSQHQGDLENVETFDDYRKHLALFAELFHHAPSALVADPHPEYLSTKLAREWAEASSLPLIEAQHHHAHVAACLVYNKVPLDAPSALGIVLDGLGWGDDGTIWGGEFLLPTIADSSGSAPSGRSPCWGARRPYVSPGAISTPI